MGMILSQIEQYWTGRAEGYSQVNQHELATGQDRVWLDEIRRHLPEGALKILDVGTGPGFFAILLTKAGYDVTAGGGKEKCGGTCLQYPFSENGCTETGFSGWIL